MNLLETIEDLRKFLPIQFPLGVFIHNNMLMTFEDRPFREGVAEAAKIFGAKQTLDESYYLKKWKEKRISLEKVQVEIDSWLEREGQSGTIAGKTYSDILWHLLTDPIHIPHRVRAKQRTINHALENILMLVKPPQFKNKIRKQKHWKAVLLSEYGEDIDGHYHPIIIRFLSAYLDQGMATWHNPDTHLGLLESFKAYMSVNRAVRPQWMKRLYQELAEIPKTDVHTWMEQWLEKLPYVDSPRQHLLETMLELRGWAGMVNKFEKEPHLVPRFTPKITLIEYLCIHLLLERSAYEHAVEKLKISQRPGLDLNEKILELSFEQMEFALCQLGATLGIVPENLTVDEAQTLLNLILQFDEESRCKIWHFAFDFTVRDECLSAVATMSKSVRPKLRPEARAYFCIDDREESLRRYVEEINPKIETLGVVGFFAIDMRFKSADHPEPVIHCPPVVTPSRIVEQVTIKEKGRRVKERSKLGKGVHHFYYGSRATISSLFYTLLTGPFTSLVLLLRVFFPYLATRLLIHARNFVIKPLPTKINYNAEEGGGGYSVPEMANVVATIMKFTGTIRDFPPLHFMVAHGASSSNNPYKNAYGCGACSGKAGIPNSQIFCGMANNVKVRNELRQTHGIDIPEETFFVACYHDTSTDEILCFNMDEAPEKLKVSLHKNLSEIRLAAKKNSLERCRHFASGRALMTEKITFQHVLNRGANLAEPRPEYGHTNNALCVIGRRELTKELYLDRRSFLTSYDAKTDPEGVVLAQVMAGAVPVAGGINLDYYFSRVDNETYGSGTKLPLNIAGLLGVMTGGQSDLRIGLAGQMVELHEPVRITILIEAEPSIIEKILNAAPRQLRLVSNTWVHMAALHPLTGELYLYKGQGFVPLKLEDANLPLIKNVREYVAHRGGSLPFGRIEKSSGVNL